MRRISTYIILLFSALALHAQNIPNGGFENWESYPVLQLDSFYTPRVNVYRTTESFVGRYALRMDNTLNSSGTGVRGYVTNVISGVQSGTYFKGDVLSVVFFAKYDLAEGDSARVYVRFMEGAALRGTINFFMTGKSDGWVKHSVPIIWYGPRTPDNVQIYMYSSYRTYPKDTGYILIDDLRFENIGKRPMDIFNHDFEIWEDVGINYPTEWSSLDLLTEQGNSSLAEDAVYRSNDAHGGNYSLRVGNYWSNGSRRSYAFIGSELADYYTPAFPMNDKYNFLEGYYKYPCKAADSARMEFRTFVGGKNSSFTRTYLHPTDYWTYFYMPITYYNAYKDSMPDSAAYIAWSSAVGTPEDSGAYLLLDDLNLVTERTVTGIEPVSVAPEIYPNPTQGIVNLNLNQEFTLEIFNSNGVRVHVIELTAGTHSIDLSSHPKGLYYFQLANDKQQWKTKIMNL